MEQITCKRCGLAWTPRTQNPKACPKCKNYNYNKPRGETNDTR